MKVYISQPMKGRTDTDIELERQKVIDLINKNYVGAEIIDSFMKGAPQKATPLENLSKSIGFFAQADLAVFPKNYKEYRGCEIEQLCAKAYNMPMIYYERLEK